METKVISEADAEVFRAYAEQGRKHMAKFRKLARQWVICEKDEGSPKECWYVCLDAPAGFWGYSQEQFLSFDSEKEARDAAANLTDALSAFAVHVEDEALESLKAKMAKHLGAMTELVEG